MERNDNLEFQSLGQVLDMIDTINLYGTIVKDIIYERSITSIYSPAGSGKTILALKFALDVCRDGGRVLYLDAENGLKNIAGRLKAMGGTEQDLMDFLYLQFPHITLEDVPQWERKLEELRPTLVVFDSLVNFLMMAGLKENSSDDVTQWFISYAQQVVKYEGSVLILDHVSKDENIKGARGSTAKEASAYNTWFLKQTRPFNRDTMGNVELHRGKDRHGALPQKILFNVGGRDGALVVERSETVKGISISELSDTQQKILSALDGQMRYGEWKQAAGYPKSGSDTTFNNARNELLSKGYIRQDDKYYSATGQAAMLPVAA